MISKAFYFPVLNLTNYEFQHFLKTDVDEYLFDKI